MRADKEAPQVMQRQDAGLKEASDEAWWDALWQMIAEDARKGNVKDPKGRNVKGRADRKLGPSNLDESVARAESGTESSKSAEVDATSEEASSALADAGQALGELSTAIGDAPSGPGETKKLVSIAESTRLV